MGYQATSKCCDCGETFTVDSGGGFLFCLLRCDKCGATKSVGFDELGEIHTRYLKSLAGPYSAAIAENDQHVSENVNLEPLAEDEYHCSVETFAGQCSCRGKYKFDAPPRCPKCHSTIIEEGDITVLYD